MPADDVAHPAAATRRPRRGRRHRSVWRLWAVTSSVVIVVVAGLVLLPRAPEGSDATGQRVTGPASTDGEQAVPPDFFGVTMNSDTGQLPGFQVGAVRLWDGGTRWSELEPARGEYRWQTLDRLVAGTAGRPSGALHDRRHAIRGPLPTRLGWRTRTARGPRPRTTWRDWDRFVRALAGPPYRGRIQAYELWVLAPSPLYYAGSAATAG